MRPKNRFAVHRLLDSDTERMGMMHKLAPSEGRVWYRRKRNIARLGIALVWLIGTLAVLAKYTGDVRSHFLIFLGGYCGVLILLSYFYFYMANYIRRTANDRMGWFRFFPLVIIGFLALYALVMIGGVLADTARGPVFKEAEIVSKWNPKRGGDRIKTSDGKEYELSGNHIKVEKGRTYRLKVLEYTNILLDATELRR